MPFFTPNRRPHPNMLEHVEPAGEGVSHISKRRHSLTFGKYRSGQVRVHPGIHLSSAIDSDARAAYAYGPTTHSYRGSRMFNISVHRPIRLLRS